MRHSHFFLASQGTAAVGIWIIVVLISNNKDKKKLLMTAALLQT